MESSSEGPQGETSARSSGRVVEKEPGCSTAPGLGEALEVRGQGEGRGLSSWRV